MKTQIISHQQGSNEWHLHRSAHFNASDIAAVMGLSSYKTRSHILKEKATGLVSDVDANTQRRFDKGHEFEASARPWAEEIIGSDLYPLVLAAEVEGLPLSASLDGLTMEQDVSFEHKTGRADLLASLEAGVIPDEYHPQLEQGLLLSGAKKCLFMASSGDKKSMRFAWYLPDLELREKIIAAWKQFAIDLAAYVPGPVTVEAVGKAPETLPALHIEVTGMVTASNLDAFKTNALAVFSGINRTLSTDAEFADAEKTVKWCADVEDRLAAAKQHALSQTESIDALFRTIDDISAEARRVRLELHNLVKARKEELRGEIVAGGIAALREHVAALNTRLGKSYMPAIAADFAGAIKGKRTVDSLRDAVSTTLANAKIEASATADKIDANLKTLRELASDHAFLFADAAQIVLKAPEDLTMLVKSRIAEHKAAEEKKEAETRERIRQEEQAKAIVEAEARAQEAIKEARDAESLPAPLLDELSNVAAFLKADTVSFIDSGRAIHAAKASSARPATPPTLTLGAIGTRLGFNLSAEFLKSLGFEATKVKASCLYQEADFQRICNCIVAHIRGVQDKKAA